MNEPVKIYVEMADDLLAWLADNGLSVEDVLEKEGVDASVEIGVVPLADGGEGRAKDVVPIILASGGAISAVLVALSHCMKTWLNRPILTTWEELEEIRDENGSVLLDEKGAPRMKTVRKHFVQELKPGEMKQKIDLKAGVAGIRVKLDTEERQGKKRP